MKQKSQFEEPIETINQRKNDLGMSMSWVEIWESGSARIKMIQTFYGLIELGFCLAKKYKFDRTFD